MGQRLGQHFLINKSAVQKIIAALELKTEDTILEIGPGKGALTLPLLQVCKKIGCKLLAIEKDPKLAEFPEGNNFQIIKGDALKILPELTNFNKIIGNIPYYITGKLLRILSELKPKPKLIMLTIQKEVAERIIAKPPKMNLLAAAIQSWAETKIIGYLKPEDFSPPPKVNSAILKLNTKILGITDEKSKKYYELIKILFKQPRKTILNNLKQGWKIDKNKIVKILSSLDLTGAERPQNLGLETIAQLSEKFTD